MVGGFWFVWSIFLGWMWVQHSFMVIIDEVVGEELRCDVMGDVLE